MENKSKIPANLISEWDCERNRGALFDYAPRSGKKFHWVCKKGHRWMATMSNRVQGSGCPYCAGKIPIVGETDLQTLFPKISAEWDEDKNPNPPCEYTAYSNKRVWWRCKKGHNWEAPINSRTRKGCSCPYCSGRLAIPGETDLATLRPDIAAEWAMEKNATSPNEFTVGSGKKAWWRCEHGHTWEAYIFSRTKLGEGCPYCTGKRPVHGVTDLATLCPDILAEWDYTLNKKSPSEYTAHSGKKVHWLCINGHSWEASIHSRADLGNGCPYCAGKYPIQGETDLCSLRPEIAAEWDYTKNHKPPTEYVISSRKKVWWLCKQGHSWAARIGSRTGAGNGCPYCAGRYPVQGETDLCSRCPEIAAEWDYAKNRKSPSEYVVSSNIKVWWICSRGHSWQASIKSRTKGSGCPYCGGRRAIRGETDLLTLRPEISSEWDYDRNSKAPYEYTLHSGQVVYWRCEQGHSWKASITSRTTNGSGCPVCSGKRLIPGINDLLTLRPDIAEEWDPTMNDSLPSEFTVKSMERVHWRCKYGHIWEATVKSRVLGKGKCPYCNKIKPLRGVNDLQTRFPEIAAEWDYDENAGSPEDYLPFSGKKVTWICDRGHRWEATIGSRTALGYGCPVCAGRVKGIYENK